jgi:hypothetical protein
VAATLKKARGRGTSILIILLVLLITIVIFFTAGYMLAWVLI